MTRCQPRGRRMLHWTLMGCVAFTAGALAHNGELPAPPMMPPPPGPPVHPDSPGNFGYVVHEVRPERWSWLHWWEANRDPYLVPLRQGPQQGPVQASVDALKAEAVVTLRRQLRSDSESERAAAAMALGRIRDRAALEDLRTLLLGDPSLLVRARVALAISMIEPEPPVANKPRPEGRAARVVANPVSSISAPVASEELLALDPLKDEAALRLLLDVLAGKERAMRLPAWAKLAEIDYMKRALMLMAMQRSVAANQAGKTHQQKIEQYEKELAEYPQKWRSYLNDFDKLKERYHQQVKDYNKRYPGARIRPTPAHRPGDGPPAPPGPPTGLPDTVMSLTLGEERMYMAKLQASAAIALARSDRKEAVAGLLELLAMRDDGYNTLPRGFAAMSLGQMSGRVWPPEVTRAIATALVQAVDKEPRESPLRGYAALALGLYARPVQTDQGPADNPGLEKILEGLARYLDDAKETDELRAACAMALGLSHRTSSLKPLRLAASELTDRDEMIGGYVLLARGLLSDSTLVPVSGRFLSSISDRTDMAGILAARAAVLGAGLSGVDEAVPMLADAWHLNYYVNREVVLALALHGAWGVGRLVIDKLKESKDPEERAYMAMVLGELFTAGRPDALARILNGSNYTWRMHPRMDTLRMCNELLFEFLIPAFGDGWL